MFGKRGNLSYIGVIDSIEELGAGLGLENVRKRGKMGDGVVDRNTRREGDAYTIRLVRMRGMEGKKIFPCLWKP
jgi:hypothetical protein